MVALTYVVCQGNEPFCDWDKSQFITFSPFILIRSHVHRWSWQVAKVNKENQLTCETKSVISVPLDVSMLMWIKVLLAHSKQTNHSIDTAGTLRDASLITLKLVRGPGHWGRQTQEPSTYGNECWHLPSIPRLDTLPWEVDGALWWPWLMWTNPP
jgi:hypothetical protein